MAKESDNREADSLRPSRVVVLIDASPDALHALESAADLARRQRVPLLAVCVEEPDRSRSAAYAFAREVGAMSGAIRPFDASALQRQRERGPAVVRRAVEEVTRRVEVAWELVIVRGQVVEEVLALSQPGDVLLLGRVGWSARIGRRLGGAPLMLARKAAGMVHICSAGPIRERGRIAVLVEDPASAASLFSMAASRASMTRRELVVLLPADAGNEDAGSLPEGSQGALAGARRRILPSTSTGEMLRVLAEERAVELLVGRDGAWVNSPSAVRLLAHWRMPVLVAPGRAA